MVIFIPECQECKKRKIEMALREPFKSMFPNDAKKAQQELDDINGIHNFDIEKINYIKIKE